MIRRAALLSFLVVAGCGGTSTVGTTNAGRSGSTSAGGSNGSGTGDCIGIGQPDNGDPSACCSGNAEPGTGTCQPASSSGSTGGCRQNGAYDFGDASSCCSGEADQSGICAAATTGGSGGTTGTPGTTATGTTTGGTCPQNMPDLNGGVGFSLDGGSCSGELGSCPNGFTCESGNCVLHGQNGGLQMALSFDDNEDFDIHVEEPNGNTVWYRNTNRPAGSSSNVTGSLDLDANAGCSINNPVVNIENVIYPSTGFASGTYKVYVDYYEHCSGTPTSSNVGVQVRANGVVWKYCGTMSSTQVDGCSSALPGSNCSNMQLITSVNVP